MSEEFAMEYGDGAVMKDAPPKPKETIREPLDPEKDDVVKVEPEKNVEPKKEPKKEPVQKVDNQEKPNEQAARARGWVPLEEWTAAGNDANEWRSAEAYLDRGSFFEKINSQKQYIDQLKGMVGELADLNKKARADERAKVLKELETMKVDAIQDGNASDVVAIDKEIETIKEQGEAEDKSFDKVVDDTKGSNYQPGADALAKAWQDKNKWFGTDSDMTQYANTIAYGFKAQMDALQRAYGPEDVFAAVDQEVRNRFPEKFGKPQPSPVAAPADASRAAPKREADTVSVDDLSEFQLEIGRGFEREGLMTLQEYAQQLRDIGEI